MNLPKSLKIFVLALTAGSFVLTTSVSAGGRHRGHHRHHHNGGKAGAAIALGILGLAIAGAASDSERRDYERYCRRLLDKCDYGERWACRKFDRECEY